MSAPRSASFFSPPFARSDIQFTTPPDKQPLSFSTRAAYLCAVDKRGRRCQCTREWVYRDNYSQPSRGALVLIAQEPFAIAINWTTSSCRNRTARNRFRRKVRHRVLETTRGTGLFQFSKCLYYCTPLPRDSTRPAFSLFPFLWIDRGISLRVSETHGDN